MAVRKANGSSNSFKQLEISINPGQCTKAALFSKGSLYMMQLIGHYITIGANKGKKVSDDDFQTALSRAEGDFKRDICETTLHSFSDRDTDFLYAMAGDEDLSTVSELAECLNVSPAYVQTYKRRLIQSGLIESPRRGRLRISMPYLKEYMRTNHS